MRVKVIISILFIFGTIVASYFFAISFFDSKYNSIENAAAIQYDQTMSMVDNRNIANTSSVLSTDEFKVIHIDTPSQLKGVYMTSWVAGTSNLRNKLLENIKDTEINSIVIDIKDATGKISFIVENEELTNIGSMSNRIPNIKEVINDLHNKGLYVIGRVAVFQDPYLIKKYEELAVKKKSNKNEVWLDKKGIGWLDVGAKEVWDYVIDIAKQSYEYGFDEINFDYIRFPSDGDMKDIYFPKSNDQVKADVLEDFFKYLHESLKDTGIVTSADLFGMTTTVNTDMNIGQVLEKALPYFDFVCPMVYPSHYPPTWNGYDNPAKYPYEVVSISMQSAVKRAIAIDIDKNKLRPWLQDFDLGAKYTEELVRDQIKATYDSDLKSWILWDPANTYTISALEKK